MNNLELLIKLTEKIPHTLTISHAPNWVYYEEDEPDKIWTAHFYKRTPIGYIFIEAGSLDELLSDLFSYVFEEKILTAEDFDSVSDAVFIKMKWG